METDFTSAELTLSPDTGMLTVGQPTQLEFVLAFHEFREALGIIRGLRDAFDAAPDVVAWLEGVLGAQVGHAAGDQDQGGFSVSVSG